MKHEYHEGREVLERFGKTMTALFRVPKTAIEKESKKPARKAKKSSNVLAARFEPRVSRCQFGLGGSEVLAIEDELTRGGLWRKGVYATRG